jgi:protein TonB
MVGFDFPKVRLPLNTTMDIVLVQKRSETPVKEANYLAQAAQEGGGESLENVHPATPTIAPFPDQTVEVATMLPLPQTATAQTLAEIEQLTTTQPSEYQVASQEQIKPTEDNTADEGEEIETTLEESVPSHTLITNAYARIASLQAELDQKLEAEAKRPRKKFITASTKEYKYANYMDAWRIKVEQIGTLNYPEQARRQKLSGKLSLDVAINANGTIQNVEIIESSGHTVLDDAALRIVHLAAPFPPFPESIRQETDILHITRTWNFLYGRLTSH